MSGEKTLSQNSFNQWEVEIYVARLSDYLLKLDLKKTE